MKETLGNHLYSAYLEWFRRLKYFCWFMLFFTLGKWVLSWIVKYSQIIDCVKSWIMWENGKPWVVLKMVWIFLRLKQCSQFKF